MDGLVKFFQDPLAPLIGNNDGTPPQKAPGLENDKRPISPENSAQPRATLDFKPNDHPSPQASDTWTPGSDIDVSALWNLIPGSLGERVPSATSTCSFNSDEEGQVQPSYRGRKRTILKDRSKAKSLSPEPTDLRRVHFPDFDPKNSGQHIARMTSSPFGSSEPTAEQKAREAANVAKSLSGVRVTHKTLPPSGTYDSSPNAHPGAKTRVPEPYFPNPNPNLKSQTPRP